MRSHPKAPFAVVVLVAFLLVPSSALAGKPINDFFGSQGTGNGQFSGNIGGIAVRQSSGDLFILDQGNNRVQRFDADGNYLSQFGSSGSGNGELALGAFNFPEAQVAIDQTDGSIYVADTGNHRVQKFTAAGAFDSVIGTSGPGTLASPRGVAVGTDGSLYVADTGNNRIVKFDPSGAYAFDFGSSELSGPLQVGVDSTGAVYVLDGDAFFSTSRVQRFTSAGILDAAVDSSGAATALAVDQSNDHVFVSSPGSSLSRIVELDSAGAIIDTHGVLDAFPKYIPQGLAVNDDGGPIYLTNGNGINQEENGRYVLILDEPGIPAPTTTIDSVTTFDSHSATFTGEVNPSGNVDARWRFQISSDGGSNWSSVGSGGTVPEGTTAQAVSDDVSGLEANKAYMVRLIATKVFTAAQGIDSTSFTTATDVPVLQALDPGPVTSTTAWLGARVNPQNSPTTFYVEYSTDPSFAPVSTFASPVGKDASAGSGGGPVIANQLVKGLQPDTVYHYRVIASGAGTTTGESRSFRTLQDTPPVQGLPDGRVWEKVSPAFKGGADIFPGSRGGDAGPNSGYAQAAVDGNAVAFASTGKFGGDGGTPRSQYLARRGPGGWLTEGINPRLEPAAEPLRNYSRLPWFSSNLRFGVVEGNVPLHPDGLESNIFGGVYMRDNTTGEYRMLSTADDSTPAGTLYEFIGASEDGKSVAVENKTSKDQFVRTFDGQVYPIPGQLGSMQGHYGGSLAGTNPISSDGSRVFYRTEGSGEEGVLHVLEDGASSILISASERLGDDQAIGHRSLFLGASADGSVAYFTSGEPLTDDSVAACGSTVLCRSLYRWDSTALPGERLTDLTAADSNGAHVLGETGISEDGSTIYFAGTVDIGDGGPKSGIFHWKEGEGVSFIASVPLDDARDGWELWWRDMHNGTYREARVTPDGRYLAFATRASLTAYDTDNKNQLYLYDSEVDQLTCVSCGIVEPRSKQGSWFLSCINEVQRGTLCNPTAYLTNNLSPDGSRLIFDSKDALVPEDSNGVTDVYAWSEGRPRLLSSGTSGAPSRLLDASEDGNDVFFTTHQRLVPSDHDDLGDLYDARVGGVPEPGALPPCVGDECQGTPSPPPPFPTPSSSSFRGAGNVSKANGQPRCRKGKVRRRGRCVAKARKGKQRKVKQANENRRAGR